MALIHRFGDVVVDDGRVTRADVEAAAIEARHSGRKLGETLQDRGALSERDVYRLLARRHEMAFAEADDVFPLIDLAVARALPRRFTERASLLPVRLIDGVVTLATSDPGLAVDDVAAALSAHASTVLLVTPTDLLRLHRAVSLGQTGPVDDDKPETVESRDLLGGDPTINAEMVATFEALLLDAIAERASDIHLEIYGSRVRVRLRVDGDLHDAARYQLTPTQLSGLINVIKVRANLDIAERRLPQGGRCSARAGVHVFDLRVQTQPSMWGEHVVIRLLPQNQTLLTIEDLGFDERVARSYRRLLGVPSGLLLVVGPTGSGKSTTLYAGLAVLARDLSRKVITVEDPIEYAIENVQQTQVRPDIGFAFHDAVRAFVREDPDVVLVGEIRDGETALEALRASQTGHLVLSTLHCNDAPDAIQRLRDLGMHPNSISSELLAVFAQRLAKRICTRCRVEAEPSAAVVDEVFGSAGVPAGFRCWKGAGCEACHGRGTHGRVAVVEHMPAGPALRRAISRELPLDDVREVAVNDGLVPMRDAALAHVGNGVISFEELPLLVAPERLAVRAR
jgi:type IV pilus assembly protein PilB